LRRRCRDQAGVVAANPRLLLEAVLDYAELRRHVSRREIERRVAESQLIRVRRGRYLDGDCPAPLVEAARQGGRLDCISLLSELGVFVLECAALHLQMDHGATRVSRSSGVVRHWRASRVDAGRLATDIVEALAQACRCQPPRAAVATLDSAWHLRLVGDDDIADVFARLPARYGVLRGMLDARSEAGPESLVRMMIVLMGASVELQVVIAGVGRVDLVVDGWLIIECDSRAHHDGWEAHRRDRRRDLAAAALGYTTIRPLAEDIMYDPDTVATAIRATLAARAAAQDVGRPRHRRGKRAPVS
jgi:very-short-patch-repair endonuclease